MFEPASEPFGRRVCLSLLLCALLLWALNHPLTTFDWHDARVYAILALSRIDPQAYARDPFFMFGSQDSFSLFSLLYAPLVKHLGLRAAHTVVMLIGGLLWCVAVLRLSLACMPRAWLAGAAVLTLAALSPNYSPNGTTFQLNEGFATARTLAFPLGMLALAECMFGQWRRAVLVAFVTTSLHPLLGVWPLAVSILWPLSWRGRWLLIVGAAAALAALMLSEVGSFARMDDVWWGIIYDLLDVSVHSPFHMVPVRWEAYGFALLLLVAAAWHLRNVTPAAARLYLLAAIVAAAGLLAATVASLCWPSRLVIQAQLWRSMWLAVALVPIALTHLIWWLAMMICPGEKPESQRAWCLLAVAALLYMLRDVPLYALLAWGAGLLLWHMAAYCLGVERLLLPLRRLTYLARASWFPMLAIAMALPLLPGILLDVAMLGLSMPADFAYDWPHATGFFLRGGLGLGFAMLAWWCVRYGTRTLSLLALAGLLGLTLWHWDTRAVFLRKWESIASFGTQQGIRDLIRSGDVVLWGDHPPMRTWYELRTAHYTSATQAIGMVFSREKTFELMARTDRIRSAWAYEHGKREWVPEEGEYERFDFEVPTGKGIPMLCSDQNLDWIVVTPEDTPQLPGANAFEYVDMGGKRTMIYVYRCSDFRIRVDK